jgi:hypothetical protein
MASWRRVNRVGMGNFEGGRLVSNDFKNQHGLRARSQKIKLLSGGRGGSELELRGSRLRCSLDEQPRFSKWRVLTPRPTRRGSWQSALSG